MIYRFLYNFDKLLHLGRQFDSWFLPKLDYLFELGWRFFAGCNHWINLGGWHFACVIIGWVVVLYGIGITWVALRRKK